MIPGIDRNFRFAGLTPRTTVERRLNYDGIVTYESVVRDLFVQMPDLEALYREQFSYLAGEELPYVVFGSLLIPVMEKALERHDAVRVKSICAYLEEVASNAKADAGLEQLLRVEIGEWLGGTAHEQQVGPYLGEQTRRICRYVPGLATQRITLRAEGARRNPIARLLNRLRG
jgi:hypothetical protein